MRITNHVSDKRLSFKELRAEVEARVRSEHLEKLMDGREPLRPLYYSEEHRSDAREHFLERASLYYARPPNPSNHANCVNYLERVVRLDIEQEEYENA